MKLTKIFFINFLCANQFRLNCDSTEQSYDNTVLTLHHIPKSHLTHGHPRMLRTPGNKVATSAPKLLKPSRDRNSCSPTSRLTRSRLFVRLLQLSFRSEILHIHKQNGEHFHCEVEF